MILEEFLDKRNTLIHRVDDVPGWSLDNEQGCQIAYQFVNRLMTVDESVRDTLTALLVEAAAFGFGVDFLDIFAERALLVFKPLDALDKRFELRARDALDIRHDPLSPCCCYPRRQQHDNREPIANQCCCVAAKAA